MAKDFILRPAIMEEIPVIWDIILQAKAQMCREGKHQWDENYPTIQILKNDVMQGWGHVLVPSDSTSADGDWGRTFSYSFGSDGRLEAANDGSYFYEFKYAE